MTTLTEPAGPAPLVNKGVAAGLFTALVFGSTFPAAKPVVDVLDPLVFSASRFFLSGLILVGFVLISRSWPARLTRRDIFQVFVVGILGFTMFQGFWGLALSLTTAANSAVLMASSAIWGAIIASFSGARIPLAGWAGILVAFAGVVTLINNSFEEITLGGGTFIGDMMWVMNAAIWAFYSTFSSPLISRIGAPTAVGLAMLIGSVFLAPISILFGDVRTLADMTPGLWLNYAWMAVVAGAITFLTWFYTIAQIGPARALVFIYLVPLVGTCLAIVFLGETMTWPRAIGGVAIMAGVIVTQSAIGGAQRRATAERPPAATR